MRLYSWFFILPAILCFDIEGANLAFADVYSPAKISGWVQHAETLKKKCEQALKDGKRCPELKHLHDSIGIAGQAIQEIDDNKRLKSENEVLKAQLESKPYSMVKKSNDQKECNYQAIRDEKMLNMGFPEAGNEDVRKGPSTAEGLYCWKRSKSGEASTLCENKNSLNILLSQDSGRRKRERREDYLFTSKSGQSCSLEAVSIEQKIDGKTTLEEKALASECWKMMDRTSSTFVYVQTSDEKSGRSPASVELQKLSVCIKYGFFSQTTSGKTPAPSSGPAIRGPASVKPAIK